MAARIGLARELYSLAICILCGFIFGCVFVVKFNRTRELLAITTTGTRVWPTVEMASRTGWSCLVVGLAVAVPSGWAWPSPCWAATRAPWSVSSGK